MRLTSFKIIKRSIIFYRSSGFYQCIIIAILAGVITGSLLIGDSVRKSLIKSSSQRLGNTGILVSSGVRYFSKNLSKGLSEKIDAKCIGLLETDGFCQNFADGKQAFDVKIFGVSPISLPSMVWIQ